MLIKVIKDVAGENLIEKNRNRRDMIVKNAQNGANILVNKLDFRNLICIDRH